MRYPVIGKATSSWGNQIAVEIGVGSPKQIRASVLDLIFHPYLVSRSSKWFELYERGAFLFRGAMEEVVDLIGVSRITIYNYLSATRREPFASTTD